MEEKSKIEILNERSEIVKDVIGKIPPFYIRWGLSFILLFILMLLGLFAVIKYPDTITSNITILTSDPPVQMVAQEEGHITLKKSDGEQVKSGDVLAIIKSSADYQDVALLKDELKEIKSNLLSDYRDPKFKLPNNLRLGDIQMDFETFAKLYSDYAYYIKNNPVDKEILSSIEQIKSIQRLKRKNKDINSLGERDYVLSKSEYNRYLILKNEKVISAKEFEDATRSLIQDHKKLQQDSISILNNDQDILGLRSDVNKLQNQNNQNFEDFRLNLFQIINKLNADIDLWEHNYVLLSAIDGKVVLLNVWKNNQYVNKGDIVMIIKPNKNQEILGRAKVPIVNSGKLKIGQTVNVRLSSHPSEEYGMLLGKIEQISPLPDKDNFYYVNVRFPHGLKTTYNKQINFSSTLQGTAEIITSKISILSRIFSNIRNAFDR